MLAFLPRSKLTRLTASQLHAIYAFRTISTPYRLFSVSPALSSSDPDEKNKPYVLALKKMIDAKGSNIGHGNLEVAPNGHRPDATLTHTIGPVVDKALTGLFLDSYNKLEAENAQGRKEAVLSLIILARTTMEWGVLQRVCKMLKKHNWAIESVAERALFCKLLAPFGHQFSLDPIQDSGLRVLTMIAVQAIEHMKIPLLIGLLEEQLIRVPSPRQARAVAHAIVTPRGGILPFIPQGLAVLLDFARVISDPQTLTPGRSQSTAHKVRSIAPTDDIVIGSMLLSGLLQAAGEDSFSVTLRRNSAVQALKLGLALMNWQRRGLDGSGGDAISLTSEEKGWAYVAMAECTAALGSPVVLESLEAAFLDDQEITSVGKGQADWTTHLRAMRAWIKTATAIFAAR